MSKLEKRFKIRCDKTPHFSSFVNLGYVVEYQRYSVQTIAKALNLLVDKDDYDPKNQKEVIAHLLQMSHRIKPTKDPDNMALDIDPDL